MVVGLEWRVRIDYHEDLIIFYADCLFQHHAEL